MSVQLNHTIIYCKDKAAEAGFLADVLGLPAPRAAGHFLQVGVADGVSLDFMAIENAVQGHHYAFLVSEGEFDAIWGRIKARGLAFWADPGARQAGEINHYNGGRGLYFKSPEGHWLEILTRPSGRIS
jgi:catechol 2,3-dioxygenase-like lactoylglutathione lyase family enzyme